MDPHTYDFCTSRYATVGGAEQSLSRNRIPARVSAHARDHRPLGRLLDLTDDTAVVGGVFAPAAAGRRAVRHHARGRVPAVTCFLAAYDDYAQAINPVIAFLQGKDLNLAYRIGSCAFYPEGPSFTGLQVRIDLLEEAFGELVLQDRAKYLATFFLDDFLSVITTTIDRDFTLTDCAIWEYGRNLVGPDFGLLVAKLAREPSLIDRELWPYGRRS